MSGQAPLAFRGTAIVESTKQALWVTAAHSTLHMAALHTHSLLQCSSDMHVFELSICFHARALSIKAHHHDAARVAMAAP